MQLRVGTYNIDEYDRVSPWSDADAAERYRLVRQVITDLGCDVLLLQEICGRGASALIELAKHTSMECYYQQPWWDAEDGEDGKPAIAKGHFADACVGVLWNPVRLTADPTSFRTLDEVRHNVAGLTLLAGDKQIPVVACSYQANPFGRNARVDEAERVAEMFTRSYRNPLLYGIVGADWDSLPADRVWGPDGWHYYVPDPYAGQTTWNPSFIHQCEIELGDDGEPRAWWADRRPGQRLLAAGFRDTAALCNRQPCAPTVGHDRDDDMGSRTTDGHRVTPALAPAVVDHEVVDTPATHSASRHLPVVTTLQL